MNGWIKLHRKILDSPTFRRPAYRALWIEILLRADHSGTAQVTFHGQLVTLKPGQFTTGAYQLAEATGVPRGTVERVLKCFKGEERVRIESDRQCSMITVLKWNEYQGDEEQMRNVRGTNEERMRTKQEYKNERMKEKKNPEPDLATPSAVAEQGPNEVNKVMEAFQMKINPTISYGNKTQRAAAQSLLSLLGPEKLMRTIEYVASIQNEQFAPTITTPYQLKEKMAQLTAYFNKNTASKNTIAVIS